MVTTPLITPERAALNTALSSLKTSNPAALDAIIGAASDYVRQICLRDFTETNYSEIYSGRNFISEPMRLRQFPVTRISLIGTAPTQALLVSNNGLTCQRATVETLNDGTGVKLQYQINGASLQTQTFLYSTYTTLTTLSAAITAFGNGFSSTIPGSIPNVDITKLASTMLWPTQGAVTCFGSGASLMAYTESISPFGTYPGNGWYDEPGFSYEWCYGWRLDGDTGELYARLPRGQMNVRIDYTAGYDTIPYIIEESVTQTAKWLYDSGRINHVVSEARLGRAQIKTADFHGIPAPIMSALSPFVDRSKVIFRN